MQPSKSSSTDCSSNSVYLVLQRYRSCKLLINETEWVTLGRDVPERGIVDTLPTGNTVRDVENNVEIQNDNDTGNIHLYRSQQQSQQQQHCGLLIYVSFASNTNAKSCWEAAETCCNVPLLTNGLWGDTTSELLSLKQILTTPTTKSVNDGDHNRMLRPRTSVTIVPQANLICTVKRHGTSLQYHQQIAKDQGRYYYELFVNFIRANLYEYYYTSTKQEIPTALTEWKRQHAITTTTTNTTTETNSTTLENEKFDPLIPPMDLFRTATTSMYGSYDTLTGLPTSDRQQQTLTKSALKKLRKIQEAHRTKHEKWLHQQQQQQPSLPSSSPRDETTNHDNVVTSSATDAMTRTAPTTANGVIHTVAKTPPSIEESLFTPCLTPPPPPPPPPPPETTVLHLEDDDDWRPTMVVAGTFGKRQGMEITSDMGPFCHILQI